MPRSPELPYLRRLEQLVNTLLGGKFEDAGTLWRMQLDLLELQRDIQTKPARRRDPSASARLQSLQSTLWHSRRFGDAFAWVLLNGDRRYIYALADNERLPVPEEGHGSRGLIAAASIMPKEGMGFPVFHDMTHLLRIGDLTLVKKDEPPLAVEVKTTVVSEKPAKGGGTEIEYRVTGYLADPRGPDEREADGAVQRRAVARLSRQLRRMNRAHARSTGEPGISTDVDGARLMSVVRTGGEGSPSRWRSIRAVIREARKAGFAYGVLGKSSLCVALYAANGLDAGVAGLSPPRFSGLAKSELLLEDRERNSLFLNTIPHISPGAQLFLPYFLYPIPRRAVFDILHGRLLLVSLVNLGRIAEALERDGFTVRVASSQAEMSRDPLVISTPFAGADGKEYVGELHQLQLHLFEMVMEFLPVEYFVETARAVTSTLGKVVTAPGPAE